eukprot:jgi/Botrbrau1/8546/Bobra.0359s0010.1
MCIGVPYIERNGFDGFETSWSGLAVQPFHAMDRLALVETEVSSHINGQASAVWMLLCSPPEQTDRGFATRSFHEAIVGSKRRTVIGAGVLHEEVTAVDSENYSLKYHLISHPENVNPFPASLLNVSTYIRCFPVTVSGTTFVRIRSHFHTTVGCCDLMEDLWTQYLKERLDEAQFLLPQFQEQAFMPNLALMSPGGHQPALPSRQQQRDWAPFAAQRQASQSTAVSPERPDSPMSVKPMSWKSNCSPTEGPVLPYIQSPSLPNMAYMKNWASNGLQVADPISFSRSQTKQFFP